MDTVPDAGAEATRGRRRQRADVADGAACEPPRLVGQPDLPQDSIADLRARQRDLKQQVKTVKKELKNKKRQKQHIMRRVAALDTQDIVQVLLDRGVQLRGAQAAAAAHPAAADSSSAAPARGPEAAEPASAEPPQAALVTAPGVFLDAADAEARIFEPSA